MEANKRDIFVYSDEGSSQECVTMLYTSLKHVCTKYSIKLVSAEDIKQDNFLDNAALLAIGGGYDTGYIKALGPEGIYKIRTYVENGGSYLGICAGAYFACRRIEFDKGGKLEVLGERDLQFYPGLCVGPTFPGFVYDSEAGACVAELSTNHEFTSYLKSKYSANEGQEHLVNIPKNISSYYNGGGHFLPDEDLDSDKVKTILYYGCCNHDAIVQCKVGQGTAILSGAHVEYIPEKMNSEDPYLTDIIPTLEQTQKQRNSLFSVLLHLLDIDCISE